MLCTGRAFYTYMDRTQKGSARCLLGRTPKGTASHKAVPHPLGGGGYSLYLWDGWSSILTFVWSIEYYEEQHLGKKVKLIILRFVFVSNDHINSD